MKIHFKKMMILMGVLLVHTIHMMAMEGTKQLIMAGYAPDTIARLSSSGVSRVKITTKDTKNRKPTRSRKSTRDCKRISQPCDPHMTFYALVITHPLDHNALNNEKKTYHKINQRDRAGRTPLHLLVRRKDATIDDVKALLSNGANILALTNGETVENGYIVPGENIHRYGLRMKGGTPPDEDFYFGNKDVMNFVLWEIVRKKLEAMIAYK